MNLEGLSSVCAELEPASSKDKEILEINVLQKFTSHALFRPSEIWLDAAFTFPLKAD